MTDELERDVASVKKPWPRWVKWTLIPAQVVLAIGAYFVVDGYLDQQAARPSALAAAAERENASLPRMIDDATRLEHVDAKGQTLRYRYTVLAEPETPLNPKRMRRKFNQRLCADDDTRVLLENGVTFEYVYERELKVLAEFRVKPQICP
ncbi:MAG: hypothetical protein RIT81_36660 [Deltaproteobacteria bacterium]